MLLNNIINKATQTSRRRVNMVGVNMVPYVTFVKFKHMVGAEFVINMVGAWMDINIFLT